MTRLKDTDCCAMKEIADLCHSETPEAALDTLLYSVLVYKASFIVFSAVTTRRRPDHTDEEGAEYGQAFRDYLLEKGLGTLVETPEQRNPHTGNGVTVWVWNVNRDALKELALSQGYTYHEEYREWNRPPQLPNL